MGLTLTTAPAAEPVTLVEAKAHLKVEVDADDTLISALVEAARQHAERFLNRQLVTATWKLTLDRWPEGTTVRLPRPPLSTITSVKYIDTAGDQQTLDAASYTVDAESEPGRVVPAYGVSWPAVRSIINAIEISYTAGYGDADAVPQAIKQAILFLVGHWYEHREEVVDGTSPCELPQAARMLLWQYRVLEMV